MRKRTNLALVSFVVMFSLALAPHAFGDPFDDPGVYVDTSDVDTTDSNIITDKFIYYHIDARGTKLFEDYGETNLIDYYFGDSAIVSSEGKFFDKVVNIEIVEVDIDFPMEIWIQPYIDNESPFDYNGFHFEIYDSQFTQRIVDQVKFLDTTTGYINDFHIYNDVLYPESQIFTLRIEAGISSFGLRQVAVVDGQQSVPEPTTMLLLGSGLIGLAGFRRKVKK